MPRARFIIGDLEWTLLHGFNTCTGPHLIDLTDDALSWALLLAAQWLDGGAAGGGGKEGQQP